MSGFFGATTSYLSMGSGRCRKNCQIDPILDPLQHADGPLPTLGRLTCMPYTLVFATGLLAVDTLNPEP